MLAKKSENSEFHQRLHDLANLYQSSHTANEWNFSKEKLTLLNQTARPFSLPVNWFDNPIHDPLWLFQLHGWEWAWPKLNDNANRDVILSLWIDWLKNVPVGQTLAWEPYPTSRRLVVLVATWQLLDGDNQLADAIFIHADYLLKHLERDLDNNHLVANAKALVWAGLLFSDLPHSNKWLDTGLHWLWQCVRLQVRSDGGHVENSTSYHVAVWHDLLSTIYLCQACGVAVPDDVYQSVQKMGTFAWALMLPNGRLPLLNDSIEDEPLPLDQIVALAKLVLDHTEYKTNFTEKRVSQVFPETGIVVFHLAQQTYLLFDAGEIGPKHCPGHGHADTLSIELWAYGQPLIVDPGTYQYPAGEWRDYFRSTAVHSTATVDNLDQSEFAGPFRVGYMANGQLKSYSLKSGEFNATGFHDGYSRLADSVIHQRKVIIQSAQEFVLIDTFQGQKQHHISLNFHLATEGAVLSNMTSVEITYPNNIQLQISTKSSNSGFFEIVSGWVSSVWYKKNPNIHYQISITDKIACDI